jgi:hypothetical protein
MTIAAEPFWVVCQTVPQRERIALLDIKHRLKIDCFFPFFVKGDIYRHTPAFPSYVFAQVSEHGWWPLRRAIGVHRVLTKVGSDPPVPAQLPAAFVHSIQRLILPRADRSLPVGSLVRVIAGNSMWAGREAFVSWSERDRVKLLFEVLGKQLEVTFGVADVEVIAPPLPEPRKPVQLRTRGEARSLFRYQ